MQCVWRRKRGARPRYLRHQMLPKNLPESWMLETRVFTMASLILGLLTYFTSPKRPQFPNQPLVGASARSAQIAFHNHIILSSIFSFLPPRETRRLSAVCRTWQQATPYRGSIELSFGDQLVRMTCVDAAENADGRVICKFRPLEPQIVCRARTLEGLDQITVRSLGGRDGYHKSDVRLSFKFSRSDFFVHGYRASEASTDPLFAEYILYLKPTDEGIEHQVFCPHTFWCTFSLYNYIKYPTSKPSERSSIFNSVVSDIPGFISMSPTVLSDHLRSYNAINAVFLHQSLLYRPFLDFVLNENLLGPVVNVYTFLRYLMADAIDAVRNWERLDSFSMDNPWGSGSAGEEGAQMVKNTTIAQWKALGDPARFLTCGQGDWPAEEELWGRLLRMHEKVTHAFEQHGNGPCEICAEVSLFPFSQN
ncbi:uncharacterized protein SPPG_00911 [Spizellomyces punctatus DAOM BR117]|uniref:F-box domain-containing protein n=1 Tax=Spizellomyces punctatus (strain DAOM BR117) TaxID=645134 RepID=A0A0L0HPT1_SPIPD|nr:uncharacterized protein SPPG_00911 [Spizellomyces punctatus DAOM BR117]KND03426.1 hypothetical protein SPPG_00911 [Spizellomyces punctatus DAOM BR117]|eukprot:XP_016611465.1 hypothetical protein SPPG_00911 [Spizellomyces punctatus DAOM BR117]